MSRNAEIKADRRRRKSNLEGSAMRKLAVDMESLDTKKFKYRWVNDVPGRLDALTKKDDWDIVSDRDGKMKDDNAGIGSQVAAHAGETTRGDALRAVLVRKPLEFFEEDAKARQDKIDDKEAAIARGPVEKAYTPEGGGLSARAEVGS